jgi:hypothetical protein
MEELAEFVYEHLDRYINHDCIAKRYLSPDISLLPATSIYIQNHLITKVYIMKMIVSKYKVDNYSFSQVINVQSADLKVKDTNMSYMSHPFYIEINCSTLDSSQRKVVCDFIKNLTSNQSINHSCRTLIIHNIHVLTVKNLQRLKEVVQKASQTTEIILTTSKPSYTNTILRSILYLSFPIKMNQLEMAYDLGKKYKLTTEQVTDYMEKAQHDITMMFIMIKSGVNDMSHITECVLKSIASVDITTSLNSLLSNGYTPDVILQVLSDNLPSDTGKAIEVISLLAECDERICQQNKPQFALEYMLRSAKELLH